MSEIWWQNNILLALHKDIHFKLIIVADLIDSTPQCKLQTACDAFSANVANLADLHTFNPFQFSLVLSDLHVNSIPGEG